MPLPRDTNLQREVRSCVAKPAEPEPVAEQQAEPEVSLKYRK